MRAIDTDNFIKGGLASVANIKFANRISSHERACSITTGGGGRQLDLAIYDNTVTGTVSGLSPAGIRHYYDVIMTAMASQITSITIVYSTVYSVTDQSKHQSSASLAFVKGIHR